MPNPWVMILVDEAVERLNRAGAPYGVRASTWTRRARARRVIESIEAEISPLQLPQELLAFWNTWDPGSLQWPVFDGFIPLSHMIDRHQLEHPPAPAVLMPIADWANSRIWIELASGTHPGGRVFHSRNDEFELSLWAFGVSGLIELVADSLERDLIDDRTGGLHRMHFDAVVKRSLDSLIGTESQRRFEGIARIDYPDHWQRAEGISEDHFSLRGATHTVEMLRDQRIDGSPLSATLVGTYQTSVGGGPLRGCIGMFRDTTGSMQVFVPQLTGLTGAIGHDGAVEIDVLAVEPNGDYLDSLSARTDLQEAVRAGDYHYPTDMILQLVEQMKYLDTSIVVTGLRPVR